MREPSKPPKGLNLGGRSGRAVHSGPPDGVTGAGGVAGQVTKETDPMGRPMGRGKGRGAISHERKEELAKLVGHPEQEWAKAELAKAELAKAELAKSELAKAELAKVSSGGSNFRGVPLKPKTPTKEKPGKVKPKLKPGKVTPDVNHNSMETE